MVIILIKIGKLEIKGICALAPMAGVADKSFRELCAGYGADYCVGEMASAKGLILGDRKSEALLEVSDRERPAAVQLFGCEPEYMERAAAKAVGYAPDAIDINMGCPTPKITSNGSGSALLKNPQLCADIVRAVVRGAGGIPVTVKIRKGWDDDSVNCVEVAKLCEDAGAAMITVHARTRAQMYAPSADWSAIKAVKEAVSVPVIGNGDIFVADDAMRMLEQTGCDAVMVGRGALGNPWIFRQINSLYEHSRPLPDPGIFERMNVMYKHIAAMVEDKGEYVGMREARKHAAWYLKGFRGASRLRGECAKLTVFGDLEGLIRKVIEANPPQDGASL